MELKIKLVLWAADAIMDVLYFVILGLIVALIVVTASQ
jgi:hypothetical protein